MGSKNKITYEDVLRMGVLKKTLTFNQNDDTQLKEKSQILEQKIKDLCLINAKTKIYLCLEHSY